MKNGWCSGNIVGKITNRTMMFEGIEMRYGNVAMEIINMRKMMQLLFYKRKKKNQKKKNRKGAF